MDGNSCPLDPIFSDLQQQEPPPTFSTRSVVEPSPMSNKKAKGADGSSESADKIEILTSPAKRKTSWKGTLLGQPEADAVMELVPENAELADSEYEEEEFKAEKEDDEDPKCPTIHLSPAEKKSLWKPWAHSLIIKVLERKVGFRYLDARIKALWTGQVNQTSYSNWESFYIVSILECAWDVFGSTESFCL
ncbi:uncharacterized protein [Euphorbia lathyris]|uniref:uncharacterized protein isoform X2 n=1 Tax=Euphorbia lathyris TaxID=212925 RepID=UPI0033142436